MKKLIFYSIVALVAFGVTSCKPKQTAYKAAYERAKEKEVPVQTNTEEAVQTQPAVQVQPAVTVKRTPSVAVQKERITAVSSSDASSLKNFSVVIGSFMNKANATSLKESMEKEGYRVILAQNEKQMYRVIIASFGTKDEAAAERDRIKAKYTPRFDDIWLLERQY
jgi:cell division septation protein DedD